MKVDLKALQSVVRKAVNEEKLTEALRSDVSRVLGPSVITDGRLEQVVEAANERLDVLTATGRVPMSSFRTSIVSRLSTHRDPQVRKFAARTLPLNMLGKLVQDGHSAVRAAVAMRVPLPAVKEMMKRFPTDDQLRHVYRSRKQALVTEAGLPQPKVEDEPFDMYGEEPLGDAAKQDRPELSEQWYKDKAMKLMQDYGRFIEFNWEEVAVNRFCESMKQTSGIEVDAKKLLEAIKDLIKEHEDRVLECDALKETLAWLEGQSDDAEVLSEGSVHLVKDDRWVTLTQRPNGEYTYEDSSGTTAELTGHEAAEQHANFVEDGFAPMNMESVDVVQELLESDISPQTYVEKARSVFSVQDSIIPAGIKKHRLGEGLKEERIPVIGKLPHDKGFRSIDEKALDRFCESWTLRQSMSGEPLKLEWSTHPDAVGKVSFSVFLK